MSDNTSKTHSQTNPFFVSLIFSLSQSALISLGKISNPLTKNIERNLEQVKINIDILEMLKEKMVNNLTGDEDRFLNGILADLQLNYADEVEKEERNNTEKKDEQNQQEQKNQ
ncbi:DUF1844 domain-containing protein [bacterium]